MAIDAPFCARSGCRNRTWEQLCYAHREQLSGGENTDVLGGGVPPAQEQYEFHDSPAAVWAQVSAAFPDTGDIVHPAMVREQVTNTLRAAVSLESYRQFMELDVLDAAERDTRARGLVEGLVEELRVLPLSLSDGDAVELSYSSLDQYGRGVEESRGLAAYGLKMEWELGGLMGFQTNHIGVPYNIPFPEYCQLAQEELQGVVVEQAKMELGRYPTIIATLTGRPPRNPKPLPPTLVLEEGAPIAQPYDALIEETENRKAALVEAERRERERPAERAKVAGLVAAKGVLVGLDKLMDSTGERRAQREAEAAHQQDVQRAREQDKLRREQLEFYRRRNRRDRW